DPQVPWYLHTLGLAHYRAGHFDEAIYWLQESLKRGPGWPAHLLNWLALAMAHERLGRAKEAQEWFAKASKWMDALVNKTPNEIGLHTVPVAWHDEFARRILRREAEALLQTSPASQ